MLRYVTAGESHGKCLTAILEGIPAGLEISEEYINSQLKKRQKGYGRGGRMQIEKDRIIINSGIRFARTTGSPISLQIINRDWENWKEIMSVRREDEKDEFIQTRPRPGHADLAGALKYDRRDIRDILERASARETAARVAAGAVAKKFLMDLDIRVLSYTRQIGEVKGRVELEDASRISEAAGNSQLRCIDPDAEKKMIDEIKAAGEAGDTLGGVFTVVVTGVPPGLGSHIQWDLKLESRIAGALMSVQAVKGVETGIGFALAGLRGSRAHDEIKYDSDRKSFYRTSNRAGGFEGGMSNGENLVISAVMKPISSLARPLKSVDIKSKKEVDSAIVRSDVCAVPAAGVAGEAAVALEVAAALLEKTGGDSVKEVKRNYKNYLNQIGGF